MIDDPYYMIYSPSVAIYLDIVSCSRPDLLQILDPYSWWRQAAKNNPPPHPFHGQPRQSELPMEKQPTLGE